MSLFFYISLQDLYFMSLTEEFCANLRLFCQYWAKMDDDKIVGYCRKNLLKPVKLRKRISISVFQINSSKKVKLVIPNPIPYQSKFEVQSLFVSFFDIFNLLGAFPNSVRVFYNGINRVQFFPYTYIITIDFKGFTQCVIGFLIFFFHIIVLTQINPCIDIIGVDLNGCCITMLKITKMGKKYLKDAETIYNFHNIPKKNEKKNDI